MITEDYVSFEVAKLLKEKGFDELTPLSYRLLDGFPQRITCRNSFEEGLVSRVTLQMAMKWLREVHNIFINPFVDSRKGDAYWWAVNIEYIKKNNFIDELLGYNSYEEACEDAIKYCLINLI